MRTLKNAGFAPAQDIVVMAIRPGEMVWFPTPYCGGRMAFGLPGPDAQMAGARPLDPAAIRHCIEVHTGRRATLERRA